MECPRRVRHRLPLLEVHFSSTATASPYGGAAFFAQIFADLPSRHDLYIQGAGIRAVIFLDYFRLIFAYTDPVFNLPSARICDYAIRCKGCGESVPAPVRTMPDTWFVAKCPLCHNLRRYLPTDVFRGSLSYKLGRQYVRN